jgi:hypothetical protein
MVTSCETLGVRWRSARPTFSGFEPLTSPCLIGVFGSRNRGNLLLGPRFVTTVPLQATELVELIRGRTEEIR